VRLASRLLAAGHGIQDARSSSPICSPVLWGAVISIGASSRAVVEARVESGAALHYGGISWREPYLDVRGLLDSLATMGVKETLGGEPRRFRRRPRSRGVRVHGDGPSLSVADRMRLEWSGLYPLPRLLIVATLLTGLAYAIVAALFLLPSTVAGVVARFAVPAVIVWVMVWFFARGEPSDQVHVHSPSMDPLRARPAGKVADGLDEPEAEPPDTEPSLAHLSDKEFDELEDRVDAAAHQGSPTRQNAKATAANDATIAGSSDENDFADLVAKAIDDLPPEYREALDHVAVTVSDQGAVQRINGRLQPLYGLYVGYAGRGSFSIGSPVRSAEPDRIVIFRDTLTHSFGSDPVRLEEEVTRTLRHELGHHLGFDEDGVRTLGL
jgi:predicted Zn-dependent protease with MMP-like domain